jgi:hypothetical protein
MYAFIKLPLTYATLQADMATPLYDTASHTFFPCVLRQMGKIWFRRNAKYNHIEQGYVKQITKTENMFSITPLIRTLVIRIADYPGRLAA